MSNNCCIFAENIKYLKLSSSYISSLSTKLVGLTPSEKEDYLLEHEIDQLRICDECGKLMEEGYCICGGNEHYCSDECLHKHYSEATYRKMSSEEDSNSYYTKWNE